MAEYCCRKNTISNRRNGSTLKILPSENKTLMIMKKFRLLLSICLISCTSWAHAVDSVTPPDYLNAQLDWQQGGTFQLSDYLGQKPVYLKIWASWCVPCRQQMPHFQHSFEQYHDQIEVIGVNLGLNDDAESVQDIINEFNLTLPMATDSLGELTKALNTPGTPEHILINRNGQIVYRGHDADTELDNQLRLLASGENSSALTNPIPRNHTDLSLPTDKPTALFFLSTWCDWYLKESRPAMSESCAHAQRVINSVQLAHPELNWMGVVSPLWTAEKDVAEYRKRYHVQHKMKIDHTQSTFHRFSVRQVPTLVIIDQGKELFRSDISDSAETLSEKIGLLNAD